MKRIFTILTIVLCFGVFGIKAQTVILSEGFSSGSRGTPPSGWQNMQYYTFSAATAETDSWRYDNPANRSVSGGFAGQFAIFDSESYSMDTYLEDIGLESPEFSTAGFDSVFISYVWAAAPASAAVANVYLEVYDGVSWKVINQYVNETQSGKRDTFNISQIRNMCNTQIRFRYYCQSGGWFAVDSVVVYSPKAALTRNVQVDQMIAPVAQDCPDQNAQLSIKFRNAGTDTVSNIPFFASIFDGVSTQNYSFVLNTIIGSCIDTIITFPDTLDIAYDSSFTFTIYSNLAGDQFRFNSDTLVVSGFKNIPLPFSLDDLDSIYCGAYYFRDSLPLEPLQIARWYNSMSDPNPIKTGPVMELGNYYKDTTFYVETAFSHKFAVPTNSSANVAGGASWQNNLPLTMFIDIIAKKDIVLDSLEVKVRAAGTMSYEIWTAKGPYVNEFNSTNNWTRVYQGSETVATGIRNKIYVGGIKIKAGDTLALNFFCSDNSAPEFYAGAPHIYENAQIETFSNHVTANTLTGQRLDRFGYNLNYYYTVECDGVFSERIYRAPVILPITTVSNSTPFEGQSYANNDVITPGKSLAYELPAPTGYTNNDFGTKWDITSLLVETENGTTIPAAHYVISNYPPSGANNVKLVYTPPASWLDSTIFITAIVKDEFLFPYCDTPLLKKILVAPRPEIDINFSASCQRDTVHFMNNSSVASGSIAYKWFFGNGDSSLNQSPSYAYKTAGSFNVTLIITSDKGVVVDTTFGVLIQETPTVSFTADNNLCVGNNVTTVNNTIFNSGTQTILWSFGDGNTSTSNQPVITYATGGEYMLKLVSIGNNGCSDSMSKQITMYHTPKAGYQESENSFCQGRFIDFQNLSTIDSGTFSSSWTFGSLATSTLTNPTQIFNSLGVYDVRLIVSTFYGCSDSISKTFNVYEFPTADFTVDDQCMGRAAQTINNTQLSSGTYTSNWDFGNGSGSTDNEPIIIYSSAGTYNVKMIVESNNGCVDSITKQVTIHERPTSLFVASKDSVCLGTFVSFQNQSSINSGIFFSNWDFGGQGTSNSANPQFQFNNPGVFDVNLVTFNSFDCRDTFTRNITVFEAPIADFTTIGECSNKSIRFINQSNVPLSANPVYTWDFNFESQSNVESPDYVFATAGSKAIYLTITLDNGCESSIAKNIIVNQSALASFNAEDGCSGDPLIITNTTNSVPLISYHWDMGDGTSSPDVNIIYTYQNETRQIYTVSLITTVNGMCPDTATQQILIGEKAICDFEILNDYLPGHRTYKFAPQRTDYLTYEWQFGDGQVSSANIPIHQYTADGNYSVTLNAVTTDNCECTKTITKSVINLNVSQLNDGSFISVYPNPTSNILNIDYQTVSNVTTLEIVDIAGKHVRNLEVTPNTQKGTLSINVSELAAGVYFLRTQTETGSYVTKFIVSK